VDAYALDAATEISTSPPASTAHETSASRMARNPKVTPVPLKA
jgi:hypothetical protein